jgi:hypothetical protein
MAVGDRSLALAFIVTSRKWVESSELNIVHWSNLDGLLSVLIMQLEGFDRWIVFIF